MPAEEKLAHLSSIVLDGEGPGNCSLGLDEERVAGECLVHLGEESLVCGLGEAALLIQHGEETQRLAQEQVLPERHVQVGVSLV